MSLPSPTLHDRSEEDGRAYHVTEKNRTGFRRSIRLYRLFRVEQTDPDLFYRNLAEDAVQQVADHCELTGRTVVDIGGGNGWFSSAFRARSGTSNCSAKCSTMSLLGVERPVSRKLRCLVEISASHARSS